MAMRVLHYYTVAVCLLSLLYICITAANNMVLLFLHLLTRTHTHTHNSHTHNSYTCTHTHTQLSQLSHMHTHTHNSLGHDDYRATATLSSSLTSQYSSTTWHPWRRSTPSTSYTPRWARKERRERTI